jgi:hypothetical protein
MTGDFITNLKSDKVSDCLLLFKLDLNNHLHFWSLVGLTPMIVFNLRFISDLKVSEIVNEQISTDCQLVSAQFTSRIFSLCFARFNRFIDLALWLYTK